MEKDLFNRLSLCVDPRKVEAAGLSAKAMRSMGIGVSGLSAKEAEHRRAQKRKIMSAINPYKAGTETLPGLDDRTFGFARTTSSDRNPQTSAP